MNESNFTQTGEQRLFAHVTTVTITVQKVRHHNLLICQETTSSKLINIQYRAALQLHAAATQSQCVLLYLWWWRIFHQDRVEGRGWGRSGVMEVVWPWLKNSLQEEWRCADGGRCAQILTSYFRLRQNFPPSSPLYTHTHL